MRRLVSVLTGILLAILVPSVVYAQASIAHAEMLNAQKLLSDADLQAIRSGIQAIAQEHADGKWRIELADEDGQTAAEYALVIIAAAAVAGLILAWATKTNAISRLFDVVIDKIIPG